MKQDDYKELWYKNYEENERGVVTASHSRAVICEHKSVTHRELGEIFQASETSEKAQERMQQRQKQKRIWCFEK